MQRLDDIVDRLSILLATSGAGAAMAVRPVTALAEVESAIEDDEFDRMVVGPATGR